MKNRYFTLCLSILILFACRKENVAPVAPVEEAHAFSISPSSSDILLPYHGKNSVVFEDSLGNQLIFKVHASLNSTSSGSSYFYNVHHAGDTVIYDYTSTGDYISLRDDSATYVLNLYLKPHPYIPASHRDSIRAIDELTIFMAQPPVQQSWSVFSKVTDFRDMAAEDRLLWGPNIIEDSITFFQITFQDVEHTNYWQPKGLAYFNPTYGIVAFSDLNQKLWRLKP